MTFCVVDLPAGFYSDDEYASEDEDDNKAPIITRKFCGVQPPPNSQDTSKKSSAKDTSNSSLPTAFTWTRNTGALRAPGTDPLKLRKEFITVHQSGNVIGQNTGNAAGKKNSAALVSRDQYGSDDGAPFGIRRKAHAKAQTDVENWAWVEEVLKRNSGKAIAPRGSLEVRIKQNSDFFQALKWYL